jgi:hypothetical protein
MSSEKAWNMFVFRDGRSAVSGATLARELADAIREAFSRPSTSVEVQLIDALLRAGELECALDDAGSPSSGDVAVITDALADMLVGQRGLSRSQDDLLKLIPQHLSEQLIVSPPEGFAYYALHPLDYSDLAASVPLSSGVAGVIGIRSIGVTLSALVAAALRMRNLHVVRMTVRPVGHPYDRRMDFTGQQYESVRRLAASGAELVVADEGPGMSGSSFLSVGEALVNAGVPRERVTFLCSRVPDADSLRAANGGERWRNFRAFYSMRNSRLPDHARVYAGGGEWRQLRLSDRSEWPACWTQMERLKFLSADRRLLFKFEGFGRFGKAVHERAQRIAEARFGPEPIDFAQGFSVYPVINGHSASERELSTDRLQHMAAYCAFRAREFRCELGQGSHQFETSQLENMIRFNVAEEFGIEPNLETGTLGASAPVTADGRMMPHEWICSNSGEFLKTDNASHGDDHFFPGPTDIAWDLAGAIVEWNMDANAADRFVSEYERLSGDRLGHRLPAYLMAYAVFRLGYCKMAAAAMNGSGEEHRLTAAYRRYRAFVAARLATSVESIAA